MASWQKPPSQEIISRREFIGRAAAGTAGGAFLTHLACRSEESRPEEAAQAAITSTGYGYEKWDGIFQTIVRGFVRNAVRTSDTFAVCDYREGLILKNFLSASGKTCDSVTRIMPAIAARIVSPDGAKTVTVDRKTWHLEDIFVSALKNATDPASKDFWEYAKPDGWDQRQVESSIVAFSLWLVAPKLMDKFSSQERKNIQNWLASCTSFSDHGNNWELFTAVNHAARLALSARWCEFEGDEKSFRADLEVIDKMYAGHGWYHDSLEGHEYDYYNFWVFASHNLYWDMMVGDRFPDLRNKYRQRMKKFLETTPYFFSAQGSHILFGRSLIYRWGTLTPLVLAYRMGLWPYSVSLLRRICNSNLAFLWESGAWDAENEKLRETLTPHSSRAVCESYINNGHPYWGMQAFFTASFPQDDPFWHAPEEPLPVEAGDFAKEIAPAGILLCGQKESGQVQIWQARCSKHYRNKYYNFSYSSHFPFNVEMIQELVPPDNILSFQTGDGAYGRRDSPYTGEIISDRQLIWQWNTSVGESKIEVESTVLIDGEIQWRAHRVKITGSQQLTAAESTYALGLNLEETPEVCSGEVWEYGRSPATGYAVFIRAIFGFDQHEPLGGFSGRDNLNSFHPRGLQASVTCRLMPGEHVLIAAAYASPRPLSIDQLLARTKAMPKEIAEFAGLEL